MASPACAPTAAVLFRSLLHRAGPVRPPVTLWRCKRRSMAFLTPYAASFIAQRICPCDKQHEVVYSSSRLLHLCGQCNQKVAVAWPVVATDGLNRESEVGLVDLGGMNAKLTAPRTSRFVSLEQVKSITLY